MIRPLKTSVCAIARFPASPTFTAIAVQLVAEFQPQQAASRREVLMTILHSSKSTKRNISRIVADTKVETDMSPMPLKDHSWSGKGLTAGACLPIFHARHPQAHCAVSPRVT